MAEIKIVFDQKTGVLKKVEIEKDGKIDPKFPQHIPGPGDSHLTEEEYKEFITHIEKFNWFQQEQITLCHKLGNSVCTIIINGRAYKCC